MAKVMHMMGMPLSRLEKREFRQPVAKTELSFAETFRVYDHVRSLRMLKLKKIQEAKRSLSSLSSRHIKTLLTAFRKVSPRTFKTVRLKNNYVIAMQNFVKLGKLNVDIPDPPLSVVDL